MDHDGLVSSAGLTVPLVSAAATARMNGSVAGSATAFARAEDVHFIVRLIDPPRGQLSLPNYNIVCGRGPFSLQQERVLLRRYGIDVLVCKASGGDATEAKLVAAREAGIPVIMVRRPPREAGDAVETVEAALDWLAGPAAAEGGRLI